MKKKLLFVNDEMVMGGVARILCNVLKRFDLEEYEIDVLILHPHGELLNEIPSGINRIQSSDLFNAVDVNLKFAIIQRRWKDVFNKLVFLFYMKTGLIKSLIKRERKKLLHKNYDIEIAAKEGFCTIFVANGDSKRKINWIHIDYSAVNYSSHHMDIMIDSLNHIDLNIAVSKRSKDAFRDLFGVSNIISIRNLMDINGLKEKSLETCEIVYDTDCVNLVSVGRFHPQKAMDRLIHAMRSLQETGVKVHLYLVGDGELKADCEALAKRLGVYEQITFTGSKRNPMPYIKQADLFCLPSLYEGYPTTIIESFFAGTPVLSCDVSGVHEQITEGVNGWIVENSQEAFISKLTEVVQNNNQLKVMRKSLIDYTYDNDSIFKEYVNAIEGKL
jgi:glycosyltransferase involved in cell wall biosynthesis